MSNKLKTLSASQLETLISETVGDYLQENCSCKISHLDTPNIDTEDDPALNDKRSMTFEIELSYKEE